MTTERVISQDDTERTVEVYDEGGNLLHIYTQLTEGPEEPAPLPEPDVLIASIAAMDTHQKAALRAALGL